MSIFLKGRIIETWSEDQNHFIEFLVGSNSHIFKVSTQSETNQLKRGDLVEIHSCESKMIATITPLASSKTAHWDPLSDVLRWRRVTGSPTRMQRLWQRQTIVNTLREDLVANGFLEVETPLLVKGTCPDTHIESIAAGDGYLVTSTEYQIKRLIVGGFENVFTLTKNFRANDRGRFHSTEFTMLEWARAFGTLHDIEEDLIRFIRKAFQKLHSDEVTSLVYQGKEIDFMSFPWERLTVREGFRKYLGLENLEDFSLNPMIAAAEKAGLEIPPHFKEDQHLVLSYLLDLLQPHLGNKTPTFLQEWPAFMTSSAQLSQKDPYTAERSELYIAGIEIADGFPFLTDPEMQKTFFDRELSRRKEEGKSIVAIDDLYIKALELGIPPGAGMALGVDRLAMVLTGATQLKDVQAFDWEEL